MEGVRLFVCIPLGTWSRYFRKIEEVFVPDQPAEKGPQNKILHIPNPLNTGLGFYTGVVTKVL